jgi:hypothetical protein
MTEQENVDLMTLSINKTSNELQPSSKYKIFNINDTSNRLLEIIKVFISNKFLVDE